MTSDNSRFWYFRVGTEIKGPYPLLMIQRFIILGRLDMKDQISSDRVHWHAIANMPEVIPEVLKQEDSPEKQERLMRLRMKYDERVRERRQGGEGVEDERRSGKGRRAPEPPELVAHREHFRRVLDMRPRRPSRLLSMLTVLLVFTALVGGGAYLLLGLEQQREVEAQPDCRAAPAPGVNWRGCKAEGRQAAGKDLSRAILDNGDFRHADFHDSRLPGANLAYANLTAADLRNADLRSARLTGADLRRADLRNTRLDGADLSYANLAGARLNGASLKGARLHKTIWHDGRVCAPGSIGTCR